MGCAVHFLEYSADRVACIRFDVASGGLRISLASVLSQTFPFSGAKVRHSRYIGTQNDAAPYICPLAAVLARARCRILRFLHGPGWGTSGEHSGIM